MRGYDEKLWQQCMDFHGHSCPGLAIGFQVSCLMQRKFDVNFSPDEELVCVHENDACGVDAVQQITGCTAGKGTLIYRPTAKQAFSFFERNTGQKARFVLEKPDDLPGEREEITGRLLSMDPEDLFVEKTPHYLLPAQAEIFDTIECEQCGEGAAEYAIRLQEGKKTCLDCFEGYSRRLDQDIL